MTVPQPLDNATSEDGVSGAVPLQALPISAAEQLKQLAKKAEAYPLIEPTSRLGQMKQEWNQKVDAWRDSTVRWLPAFLVNHSSNVIGFAQIAADMAMWKSNGFNLLEFEKTVNGQVQTFKAGFNPIKWVYYPARNVFTSIFTKSKGHTQFKDLANPEFYKESVHNFLDLKSATILDSVDGTRKLVNTWNARSGFACISTMTFAALLPETRQTDEETLAEVLQAKNKPITYVGTQVGRALWFLPQTALQMVNKVLHPNESQQIGKYKHQFVGLGFVLGGLFSTMSGFRQVQGKIVGQQRYMRNIPQMIVGFFTAVAGEKLLLGVDADKAWKGFGLGMIMRNVALPFNVIKRFQEMEQGAAWYATGQGIFQVKNVFAFTAGGAEKKADGTIIDHEKMATETIAKFKEEQKREEAQGFVTDAAPKKPVDNTLIPPEQKVNEELESLADRVPKKPGHIVAAKDTLRVANDNAHTANDDEKQPLTHAERNMKKRVEQTEILAAI